MKPHVSKHVFLPFYAPLSLIIIILSRYCQKYEMQRQLLQGIQFHFIAPVLDRYAFSHISVKPNLISHYCNSCLSFRPCPCNREVFHVKAEGLLPCYMDMLSHISVKPNLISHYYNSCLSFSPCHCNSNTKLSLCIFILVTEFQQL